MPEGGSDDINHKASNNGLILVVEDDVRTLRLEKFVLEEEGFSIMEAGSGEAALEALAASHPLLVLLDIGLPGIDGFMTCQRIRESSQVPIIMVTAEDRDEDKVRGLEMGADDYVTKPFSTTELAARVKAVIRRADLLLTRSAPTPGPTESSPSDPVEGPPQERATPTSTLIEAPPHEDEGPIYEGNVRLAVESTGSIRGMINFVDELRQSQQFHLLRLVADQNREGMDIWLRLRGPLELKSTLLEMEGVYQVEGILEDVPNPDERLLRVSLG